MPNLSKFLNRHEGFLQNSLGKDENGERLLIEWRSKSIPAIQGPVELEGLFDRAGFLSSEDFSLSAPRSDFGEELPETDTEITISIEGKKRRTVIVKTVRHSHGDPNITLTVRSHDTAENAHEDRSII